MRTQKFLAPIYGLKTGLKNEIVLSKNLFIRNINLFDREDDFFRKYKLLGDYKAVLEVNYKYNPNNVVEPVPGVFLKVINKFDSSLVVYADGNVGVAAVLPSPKEDSFPGGQIMYPNKVQYSECLEKDIDDGFVLYYEGFSKAYDMRPVAFDVFRHSQDRFSNNDRSIDSCTVLESIFVPREERSKKIFILNGMAILGFSGSDIERVDFLIQYRNAVIHADRAKQLKLLSGKIYTSAWFEETFKLIRKILYRFVENPWD